MQLLPWGGKLTSESIKFFSPIVIWSKFTSSQDKHDALYSAFMEYYKVEPTFPLASLDLYILEKKNTNYALETWIITYPDVPITSCR